MIIDIFDDFYWIYEVQVVRVVDLVMSNTHNVNPSYMPYTYMQFCADVCE